ncbi:hypothetical protein AVEN_239891-1 [Araneus ventricosus]|uniref:Uncharacterized protein n=1 Tax=Araneus ventricosus TaxID=182803 RepID=A0A4Y2LAH0_ARAVE|nr:hypothetical protein AVEN_239891-1 [Araneus ventricosus]
MFYISKQLIVTSFGFFCLVNDYTLRVNLSNFIDAMVKNDLSSSSKPPKFGLPEFYCWNSLFVCVLLKIVIPFSGIFGLVDTYSMASDLPVAMVASLTTTFMLFKTTKIWIARILLFDMCIIERLFHFQGIFGLVDTYSMASESHRSYGCNG